jgi:two-component system, NarL family, invasion response regulator UvrY
MSTQSPIIHLAVADDHAIVRKGICAIIQSFGGFEIDIEADNGEELINKLEKAKTIPDICLLDINMPQKNGYDALIDIKIKWPTIKILVLTIFTNEYAIIRMLRSGANGYILKNCNPLDLKNALLTIQKSGYFHSDFLSTKANTEVSQLPKITDKEIQFLSLCCIDGGYKEIADLMGLSVRTVEGYRDSLFEKLKIKTRTGLVMYAISIGIVPFSSGGHTIK